MIEFAVFFSVINSAVCFYQIFGLIKLIILMADCDPERILCL